MEKIKNMKMWQKVTLGLFVVFLLSGGMSIDADQDKTTEVKNETSASEAAEQEEAVESLADRVDAVMKETFGVEESYTEYLLNEDAAPGSLIGYISRMEDERNGSVKVFVQTDLTREEAESLGTTIMGNAGFQIEELDWIIVRGVDGREYDTSRNSIPALR